MTDMEEVDEGGCEGLRGARNLELDARMVRGR